jgi:hypothetical protein
MHNPWHLMRPVPQVVKGVRVVSVFSWNGQFQFLRPSVPVGGKHVIIIGYVITSGGNHMAVAIRDREVVKPLHRFPFKMGVGDMQNSQHG